MRRHVLRIAGRIPDGGSFAIAALSVLAWSFDRPPAGGTQDSPNVAWVKRGCVQEFVDTTGWPQYRVGTMRIAVPAKYRAIKSTAVADGDGMLFERTKNAGLDVRLNRDYRSPLDDRMAGAPREESWCFIKYGGYEVEVRSTYRSGHFTVTLRTRAAWNGPDEDMWLHASLRATTLEDATELRNAMRTLTPVGSTGSNP